MADTFRSGGLPRIPQTLTRPSDYTQVFNLFNNLANTAAGVEANRRDRLESELYNRENQAYMKQGLQYQDELQRILANQGNGLFINSQGYQQPPTIDNTGPNVNTGVSTGTGEPNPIQQAAANVPAPAQASTPAIEPTTGVPMAIGGQDYSSIPESVTPEQTGSGGLVYLPTISGTTTAGYQRPDATFWKTLWGTESRGGNPGAANNELGSSDRRGHLGATQYGLDRIDDLAADVGLNTKGWKLEDYRKAILNNPRLQAKLDDAHINKIDEHIKANNLTAYIGQIRNGEPVTLSSLRSVSHFAGPAGLEAWLKGKDRKDVYGTSTAQFHVKASRAERGLDPDTGTPVAGGTGTGGMVGTGGRDTSYMQGVPGTRPGPQLDAATAFSMLGQFRNPLHRAMFKQDLGTLGGLVTAQGNQAQNQAATVGANIGNVRQAAGIPTVLDTGRQEKVTAGIAEATASDKVTESGLGVEEKRLRNEDTRRNILQKEQDYKKAEIALEETGLNFDQKKKALQAHTELTDRADQYLEEQIQADKDWANRSEEEKQILRQKAIETFYSEFLPEAVNDLAKKYGPGVLSLPQLKNYVENLGLPEPDVGLTPWDPNTMTAEDREKYSTAGYIDLGPDASIGTLSVLADNQAVAGQYIVINEEGFKQRTSVESIKSALQSKYPSYSFIKDSMLPTGALWWGNEPEDSEANKILTSVAKRIQAVARETKINPEIYFEAAMGVLSPSSAIGTNYDWDAGKIDKALQDAKEEVKGKLDPIHRLYGGRFRSYN